MKLKDPVLEAPVTLKDPVTHFDPASSVPMRRKANQVDHTTLSLSRLESKKSCKTQDYFMVESTGDCLENKPILEDPVTSLQGLSSCELQTLDKLNHLVQKDTLAFVKAKEDFKAKSNFPGLLYSDVIRQNFSFVPYFHYAEDNRLMWLHR